MSLSRTPPERVLTRKESKEKVVRSLRQTEKNKKEEEEEEETTFESADACLESLNFVDEIIETGVKVTESKKELLKSKLLLLIINQAKLEGKINALENENKRLRQEMKEVPHPVKSFAETVEEMKMAMNPKIKQIEDNKDKFKHTLFIKGKNNENIKDVQKQFTKFVKPTKEKIKIKSIRTTPTVVIVETESEEDVKKIMENREIKTKLVCEKQKKKRPLLILYNVPSTYSDQDISETIYEQNFEDRMDVNEFKEQFKLRFKTGPREKPTVHHVVEVSPDLRKEILTKQRLYLHFQSIAVKDFLTVPKCRRCHDLGHVMKYCSAEEEKCDRCGGNHKNTLCREEHEICIPCKFRKKKCTAANTKECATYQMLMNRLIQKTDYGQ